MFDVIIFGIGLIRIGVRLDYYKGGVDGKKGKKILLFGVFGQPLTDREQGHLYFPWRS